MPNHWRRSRVTKALTDRIGAGSFSEAEALLDAVRVSIVIGVDQLLTAAGQAAALTAIATARKCFGRVTLVTKDDAPLLMPLPLGETLRKAARRLGARVATQPSGVTTHTIRIGNADRNDGWNIRCWWDRWLSGTRALDHDATGDSRMPLAGAFSAAMAVRQVFACVVAGRNLHERDVSISLWTPWLPFEPALIGPDQFDVPDKLWLLGLGHLGQGFVWNLGFLPCQGDRRVVLQDDQTIGDENEATSLLVIAGDIGKRKTRVAANWLEACGWKTEQIERRHWGDIVIRPEDPPYLLCGLDRLEPRLTMARHGFDYMIDAGVGHGPVDFEGIQLRTIAKGASLESLWCESANAEGQGSSERLLAKPAYVELEQRLGKCGTFGFAEASVAVPFVGAATGALVIAQAIRLASLQAVPRFLQVELGSPEMATLGGLITAPSVNLGSCSIELSNDNSRHCGAKRT
jgi:hypothetical protein